MSAPASIDRLAMRTRPAGSPVMHQNWENLLFLHWPISPDLLRPLIPPALEIDTFEGQAYVGMTPFALNDLRLVGMPPIPGLSSFNELNVRTYVTYRDQPGIWFFSLDASKMIAAAAARMFFMLPYFAADIDFRQNGQEFSFRAARSEQPNADFEAKWRVGIRLRDPDAESLAFFLVERYCYFATDKNGQVYQTRVYHAPWILEEAILISTQSSMLAPLGLPAPVSEPLAHFGRIAKTDIWAPQPV